MARRKKRSSYKRRGRSRRMGAMGGVFNEIIGVAIGAAAGRVVSQKLLPAVNPTLKSAGVIAVGGFLMPKLIKGTFGSSIGAGMIAAGSLGVLQGTGVLGAIDDAIDGIGMQNIGFADVGAIDYGQDMGAVDEIMVDESMAGMDEEEF